MNQGKVDHERVVAVGLLTRSDLTLLGPTFTRLWPVDDAPAFPELVRAIDEADRALREGGAAGPGGPLLVGRPPDIK